MQKLGDPAEAEAKVLSDIRTFVSKLRQLSATGDPPGLILGWWPKYKNSLGAPGTAIFWPNVGRLLLGLRFRNDDTTTQLAVGLD